MKKTFNLKKPIIVVMTLITMLSFVSCSDNDDPNPLTVNDVNGTYQGKMDVITRVPYEESSEVSGVDVSAVVKNDTIYFSDYPILDILQVIEGEDAERIAETLEGISYKVGFTSGLNETRDSIFMTLDPKPLEFTYIVGDGEEAEEKQVSVTFETNNNGNAYSSKKLKANIVAKGISLDDEPLTDIIIRTHEFVLYKR